MFNTQGLEILFVSWSFLFQLILIIHFAVRKWHFDLAMRFGWIVYALSIPAGLICMFFLLNGQSWYYWLGGLIYLVWAAYGYRVEYVRQIEWRSSVRWSILGPYVTLYLATVMFYWWPLALIYKPLWYAYAILFLASTILNVTSHHRKSQYIPSEGIT
jgi:hypothetical protein